MIDDIMTGIGVYLTEKGKGPVLVIDDHEVVLLTHDGYGWTRDGKANSPQTREVYGDIRAKLYDLCEPRTY